MYRVLLPGQKCITIMLPLPYVFFSIYGFPFFLIQRLLCVFCGNSFDYVLFKIVYICNHRCPNIITFKNKLEQSNYDAFVHYLVTCMWKPSHTIDSFLSVSLFFFKLSINKCVTKIYSQNVCMDHGPVFQGISFR